MLNSSVKDKNTIPVIPGSVNRYSNAKFFFQPKLTINQPNDIYEQEADAMADKVMRMTSNEAGQTNFFKPAISSVQRMCAGCEEEEKKMQRKEMNSEETTAGSTLENYVGGLSSGGQSLPDEVLNFYEPRLGYDFSKVKVHTDTVAAKSAQSINALAYTSGNNIVFNNSQYSPQSEGGKRLLGHELVHVMQQNSDSVSKKIQRQPDFLRNLDPSCQVDWQAVWERRFDPGRDLSCGAQTPLGRINTSDIYAAYRYLFGNRPPGTPSTGSVCPSDRIIPWGGCCPANTHYDSAHLRCAEYAIDITVLPCPPNWTRTTLGICFPPIVTGTAPSTDFILPDITFPRFRPTRSFGSISSMTIDHFDFDGSSVPSGHEGELDHLVSLLNIYHEVNVHVDGYTDSEGSPVYNQGLSQRRADAVKAQLVDRGIDPARIITQHFGESQLQVSPERSDEDRARNRRVEIWYITQPAANPFETTLTPPTL